MTNMKPILFNTEMVRAILNNCKTVTRRVVKPQPREIYHDGKLYEEDGDLFVLTEDQNGQCFQIVPPYRPGDILYVRETWQKNPYGIGWPYFYKASPEEFDHAPDKWRPSIHMPREAARIFLRVTDVRVERLQDITPDGIEKEGIVIVGTPGSPDRINPFFAFKSLWDSTLKSKDRDLYGWDANPWVWVYKFERISKEEALAA